MEALHFAVRLDLMMKEDRWLWIEGESSFSVVVAYRVITFEIYDRQTVVIFPFQSFGTVISRPRSCLFLGGWSWTNCLFLGMVGVFFAGLTGCICNTYFWGAPSCFGFSVRSIVGRYFFSATFGGSASFHATWFFLEG